MTDRLICIDFESFYSTAVGYTLKKMTTEAYIRDPRFAAVCMGYYLGEGKGGWVKASEIPQFLRQFDWGKTCVLCHNVHFDGLILSHHYGIHPSRFVCTLSMARALYPDEKLSLEALAQEFGLRAKSVPYGKMDGVHPNDMDKGLLKECGLGAADDCIITARLFKQVLADGFPRRDLPIVDMTVQHSRLRFALDELRSHALRSEKSDWRSAQPRDGTGGRILVAEDSAPL